jgi:hypothetical protein
MLVWNPEGVDDALWARLREHFSEEEIVELGAFVALTFGQQRVIKTWGVGHEELPAEAGAGLRGDDVLGGVQAAASSIMLARIPGSRRFTCRSS